VHSVADPRDPGAEHEPEQNADGGGELWLEQRRQLRLFGRLDDVTPSRRRPADPELVDEGAPGARIAQELAPLPTQLLGLPDQSIPLDRIGCPRGGERRQRSDALLHLPHPIPQRDLIGFELLRPVEFGAYLLLPAVAEVLARELVGDGDRQLRIRGRR
jgi:hypothetical protein